MNLNEKYIKLLKEAAEGEPYIDILNEYAWELSRIDTAKALSLAQDALLKSEDVYPKGIAESYRTIAQCYWLLGDYSTAIDNLEESLQLFKSLNLKKGEADTLNLFGGVYSNMDEPEKSIYYYKQALAIRIEIGDNEGVVKSKNSIGDNLMKRKKYQEALLIFEEAFKIEHQNEMFKGIVLYNISEAHFHLDQLDKSEYNIELCQKLGDKLQFTLMTVYCETLKGKIESKKKRYEKSIKHLENALDLAKSIKVEERIYHILEDLSKVYELTGQFETSLKHYKEYHATKENVLSKDNSERLKTVEHRFEIEKLKSETESEKLKNIELKKAYSIIEESRDKISEQNKEITDSIKYAKRIQKAIMPSNDFFKNLAPQSFVFYRPKDTLSGDFYWVSGAVTDKKEKFILASVVDCTGHGVPGALMSIIGNNYLRICEKESSVNRPSEALDLINVGVSKTLRQEFSESTIKDGMDMSFVAIDYPNMKLHFAGAKSPLYLIRNNELFVYKGDKHPIGSFVGEDLLPFTNNEIDMVEGDIIYMFSDGYIDQFGGENIAKGGKKFLTKRFKKLLLSICSLPMENQKELLIETFDDWKGDLEQLDDVCVMGIKI